MTARFGGNHHASLHRVVCALFLFAMLNILAGCDYARMKDDESLRTYKTSMPEMPKESIPVTGGIEVLREADPKALKNPLPSDQQVIERGRIAYGYYCVHCHGPKADGFGTVGQSFAPLPTNLKDKSVQDQTDGEIFFKMSLGSKRQPPLAYTVSEKDRWAIIRFIRSLASRTSG
jgi:mono/diheme cytochrome c family protein